jgi:ATP-dependent Clp protease ATP-binding subunit ClpC
MVVVFAQEEARTLKHNHIGTEHILLGLLREEEDGPAAKVLESLDVTLERVRAQVVRIVGSGEEVISGQIPFTPDAKRVLEIALREALSLGQNYIGTEHLLLGLVRKSDGVATRILLELDANADTIRSEVIRRLGITPRERGPGLLRQAPGRSIQVDLTSRVNRLLMVAAARSLDDGRTEIELCDLLLALTPVLVALGVEESVMVSAIDRLDAGEEPSQTSSED